MAPKRDSERITRLGVEPRTIRTVGGFIPRGFKGLRRTPEELAARLPPGHSYERGLPVLTAGPTPGAARRVAPAHRRHGGRVARAVVERVPRAAADRLLDAGLHPERIRTERFGRTR